MPNTSDGSDSYVIGNIALRILGILLCLNLGSEVDIQRALSELKDILLSDLDERLYINFKIHERLIPRLVWLKNNKEKKIAKRAAKCLMFLTFCEEQGHEILCTSGLIEHFMEMLTSSELEQKDYALMGITHLIEEKVELRDQAIRLQSLDVIEFALIGSKIERIQKHGSELIIAITKYINNRLELGHIRQVLNIANYLIDQKNPDIVHNSFKIVLYVTESLYGDVYLVLSNTIMQKINNILGVSNDEKTIRIIFNIFEELMNGTARQRARAMRLTNLIVRIEESLHFADFNRNLAESALWVVNTILDGRIDDINFLLNNNIIGEMIHSTMNIPELYESVIIGLNYFTQKANPSQILRLIYHNVSDLLNNIIESDVKRETIITSLEILQNILQRFGENLLKYNILIEKAKITIEETEYPVIDYDYKEVEAQGDSKINRLNDDLMKRILIIVAGNNSIKNLIKYRVVCQHWRYLIDELTGTKIEATFEAQKQNGQVVTRIPVGEVSLYIRHHINVVKLTLRNFFINDEELISIIRESYKLTHITIENCHGFGWKSITRIVGHQEAITYFEMTACVISEYCLAIICTGLKELEILRICDNKADIIGHSLSLIGAKINDVHLSSVGKARTENALYALALGHGKNVKRLSLCVFGYQDINWNSVMEPFDLNFLSIIFESNGRGDLKAFRKFKNLEILSLVEYSDNPSCRVLSHTNLSEVLTELPALERLYFGGWPEKSCQVSGDILQIIANICPHLKSLNIRHASHILDSDLVHLNEFKELKKITLIGLDLITNNGIKFIFGQDNLRILHLIDCPKINALVISHVLRLASLHPSAHYTVVINKNIVSQIPKIPKNLNIISV